MENKSLAEIKEELALLIQYAAPEELRQEAMRLVTHYQTDIIALRIFHNFYSYLPEGKDDAIKILRLLARRQGIFLICASTVLSDYLYLGNCEGAELAGNFEEGIWDKKVLEFLNMADREAFKKKFHSLDEIPVHVPTPLDDNLCPACLVDHGDPHTLGCPVEICPWCGGQLTACNCRFSQLNKEKISTQSQINSFIEQLEEKGRIPFDATMDRPEYPDEVELISKKDNHGGDDGFLVN